MTAEKKFTAKQWKAMRIITEADSQRAQVRADEHGRMWIWRLATGQKVWADRFVKFPFRNDLHRIMSPGFNHIPQYKP